MNGNQVEEIFKFSTNSQVKDSFLSVKSYKKYVIKNEKF